MKNISKVKRVIIFGLDGIGRFFQQANTPTIDNFLASGASTLKARAIFPTDSAENWSSILTGVKPEKNKHRLKHEELETGDSYPENSSFPSLFKLIATEFPGAKMASFAGWWPINTGMIELSVPVHRYAPLINESETRQKELDKHYQDKSSIYDKDVVTRVVEYIKNDENKDTKLLFIHFTDADEHGHHWGYGTSQHLEQIKTMDSQIDRILETVEQVGWKDDTLIIMTTDHGGINQTKDDGTTQGRHGGSSDDEMNVFLAVCDPGITPNSKIEGKVVNMDCAAIILKALGVEIPKYFDAKLPFSPLSKFTIRSGGQTGVDQGALDAALDYNEKTSESFVLNITGWCPKERRWEGGGKIPEKYPLIETKTSEYEERTKLNVRDADATLIILLNSTTSHGKGTDFTMEKAKELHKPLKIIYLDNDLKKSVENVVDWIFRNRFDSLNVAGPRESHYFNVHIHDLTREFITKLLVKIESKVQQEQRLRANLQVSSK